MGGFLEDLFAPPAEKRRTWLRCRHLEGIPGAYFDASVSIYVLPADRQIGMQCKEEKHLLPYEQICRLGFITWERTVSRERSVYGGAMMGLMLNDPALAVVGAIDAKGKYDSRLVRRENALEIVYNPQGDKNRRGRLVFWSEGMELLQFCNALADEVEIPVPRSLNPPELKKGSGPNIL